MTRVGQNYRMTYPFTTFTLREEDIGIVFPLIQAIGTDIDLSRWDNFARHFIDKPTSGARGIIGLRSAAGYVSGLFIYRVEHDLRHGTVLAIDLFTALDLFNEERAVRALMQGTDAKARELNCKATRVRVNTAQPSLAHHLAAANYRPAATLFCSVIERKPLN